MSMLNDLLRSQAVMLDVCVSCNWCTILTLLLQTSQHYVKCKEFWEMQNETRGSAITEGLCDTLLVEIISAAAQMYENCI